MIRRLWLIPAGLTSLLALIAAAAVLAPLARADVTGTWVGQDASTYMMQQSGASVSWYAHSADPITWAHDFTGTMLVDTISGTWQDRAGYPIHNSGSLSVRLADPCHLQYVSSSASFGTVSWTKSPCPADDAGNDPAGSGGGAPIGSAGWRTLETLTVTDGRPATTRTTFRQGTRYRISVSGAVAYPSSTLQNDALYAFSATGSPTRSAQLLYYRGATTDGGSGPLDWLLGVAFKLPYSMSHQYSGEYAPSSAIAQQLTFKIAGSSLGQMTGSMSILVEEYQSPVRFAFSQKGPGVARYERGDPAIVTSISSGRGSVSSFYVDPNTSYSKTGFYAASAVSAIMLHKDVRIIGRNFKISIDLDNAEVFFDPRHLNAFAGGPSVRGKTLKFTGASILKSNDPDCPKKGSANSASLVLIDGGGPKRDAVALGCGNGRHRHVWGTSKKHGRKVNVRITGGPTVSAVA